MRRLEGWLLEVIIEAYESGFSSLQIAERVGFHQTVVSKYLRRLGIRRGRSRESQALGRKILALRLDGLTYKEIAAALETTQSTIANHLREAGFPGRQNRPTTTAERRRIRNLRARGLTYLEIARATGRDHSTIRRVVAESEGRRPVRPRERADYDRHQEEASP